jgi:hypothetical protein
MTEGRTPPKRRIDVWPWIGGIVAIYAVLWLPSGGFTALACGFSGGAWVHHGGPWFENDWFQSESFCVKGPYYDLENQRYYNP